jgi:hypothetical protein
MPDGGLAFKLKGAFEVDSTDLEKLKAAQAQVGDVKAKAQVDTTQVAAAQVQVKGLQTGMAQISGTVIRPQVGMDGLNQLGAKINSLKAEADALAVKAGAAVPATKGGAGSAMGAGALGGMLAGGAIGFALMAPQLVRSGYGPTVGAALKSQTAGSALERAYGSSAFNSAAKSLEIQTGFLATDFQKAALAGKSLSTVYGLQTAQIKQLLPLAADYAATSPVEGLQTVSGAFDAISGAIKGEASAADQLGLTLSDTYMKTTAMGGAYKDTWATLSDTAKVQARYTEALKQSQDIMGKASDKDSVPNKIRDMNTALAELGSKVGETVAPAVGKLADAITKLVDSIPPWMISAVGWVAGKSTTASRVQTAIGAGVAGPYGPIASAIGQITADKMPKGVPIRTFDEYGNAITRAEANQMASRGGTVKVVLVNGSGVPLKVDAGSYESSNY